MKQIVLLLMLVVAGFAASNASQLPPVMDCPASFVPGQRITLAPDEVICDTTGDIVFKNISKSPWIIREGFRYWYRELSPRVKTKQRIFIFLEDEHAFAPMGEAPGISGPNQENVVFRAPKNEWATFWVIAALAYNWWAGKAPDDPTETRFEVAYQYAYSYFRAMQGWPYSKYRQGEGGLFQVYAQDEYVQDFVGAQMGFFSKPVEWK